MFEELLALGHRGAEYDAWLIRINGEQFGSGFVAANPNSKIPALIDRSGPTPFRFFESGSILLHLAEKFGEFLPKDAPARAEASRGCSGRWAAHPISAAASATSMPMRRSRSNMPSTVSRWKQAPARCARPQARRQRYLAGDQYTIADIAVFPWYGGLVQGLLYSGGEFLSVQDYKNVQRWTAAIAGRPAVRARPDGQPRLGRSRQPTARAHDASDFETKTQDKIGEPAKA